MGWVWTAALSLSPNAYSHPSGRPVAGSNSPMQTLQMGTLYALLAPYDHEQNQIMLRLARDEVLQRDLPLLKSAHTGPGR